MKRILEVQLDFNNGNSTTNSTRFTQGDLGTHFLKLNFTETKLETKDLIINYIKQNKEITSDIVTNISNDMEITVPQSALNYPGDLMIEFILKDKISKKFLTANTVINVLVVETLAGAIAGEETSKSFESEAAKAIDKVRTERDKAVVVVTGQGESQIAALREYLLGEGEGKNTEFLGGRGAHEYLTIDEFEETKYLAGVRFIEKSDGTGYEATRLGVAKNQTISRVASLDDLGNEVETIVSTFDPNNIYPFCDIENVIVDNNLNIVSRVGASNYDDTLSTAGFAPHTHLVMNKIPKFYYKWTVKNIPGTNGHQEIEMMVSKYNLKDFKLHPLFLGVNEDGSLYEKDYALSHTFGTTLVKRVDGTFQFDNLPDNESVRARNNNDFQFRLNGVTNTADYFLTSVNARNKQAPTTNFSIPQARELIESRNSSKKITQETFYLAEARFLLQAIEFANMNGQSNLGNGVSTLPSGTGNEALTVGYTTILGNSSGKVKVTGIKRNNAVVSDQFVVSYRGVENPFSNVWRFLEGMKTGTAGKLKYGVYNPHVTNNYADYNASSFANEIETRKIFEGSGSGYWKNFLDGDGKNGGLVPDVYKDNVQFYGGNHTARHGDYVWHNTAGGQIGLLGGCWTDGSFCGFACLHLNNSFASANRLIGAGLSA